MLVMKCRSNFTACMIVVYQLFIYVFLLVDVTSLKIWGAHEWMWIIWVRIILWKSQWYCTTIGLHNAIVVGKCIMLMNVSRGTVVIWSFKLTAWKPKKLSWSTGNLAWAFTIYSLFLVRMRKCEIEIMRGLYTVHYCIKILSRQI